jgi:hypothetical protein
VSALTDNIQRTATALLIILVCLAGPSTPMVHAQGDQFLVSAFTPQFPIRGITVQDFGQRDRLVKITAEQDVRGVALDDYVTLLLSRGISVYGATYYGSFDGNRSTVEASIIMTRKAAGETGTVDVSTSVAKAKSGKGPVNPLFVNDKELTIPVEGDFGRKWQRLTILPEQEPTGEESKVGRFPGARLRLAEGLSAGKGTRKRLVYAARGTFADVSGYYEKALKGIHATITTTGSRTAPHTPTELFGIKTFARQVTVAGYTYRNRVMYYTEVTLKQGVDPNLAEYVEIEVLEN